MPEETKMTETKEVRAETLDDRVAALIASLEHAAKHNSPITAQHLAEVRALFGVEEKRAAE